MARTPSPLAYYFFVASTAAFALAQNLPPTNGVPPTAGAPGAGAVPPAGAVPGAGGAPGAVPGAAPGAVPGAGAGGIPGAKPAGGVAGQMPPGAGPPGAAGAAGAHGAAKPPNMVYGYDPSFSMAIAGSILFIISATISSIQLFRYKAWCFSIIPQAALASLVAAIVRTHSVLNLPNPQTHKNMTPYIVQMICFGIAPSLIGISIFFSMTRVIWWVTPNDKRNKHVLGLPPHHLSFLWGLTFVIPDMIKGVVGQLGSPKPPKAQPGMPPPPPAAPNTGDIFHRVEEICLVIQVFALGLYTIWATRFMLMSSHWLVNGEAEARNWRALGWANVVAAGLVTFRIIWGVVEFDARSNRTGFVAQHEWTFWMGNVLPVLLIYTIYQVHYPGKYLPREYTRFKFDTKKLEKQKLESSWPLPISNPIHIPNDKDIEIITREVVPSSSPSHGHRR